MMNLFLEKKVRKSKMIKRQDRIRYKLKQISDRSRLTVFKSNNHIYAQLIDDSKGITLASSSSVILFSS